MSAAINEILPNLGTQHHNIGVSVRDERFPHLRHVVTTDYKRINKGILNFRHLLAYDVYARDPIKRAKPFVTAETPLLQPVSVMGIAPPLTHGDISKKATEAAAALSINNSDKLFLDSRSPLDLAVGLAVACEQICPLVLPSPIADDAQLFTVEECTKRIETFA